MIEIANRTKSISEYYFSKKLSEIEALNTPDFPNINLGIGNPDLMPDGNVISTLNEESLNPKNHGYQKYNSAKELRTSFSEWYKRIYNVNLNPENEILPLIGSKEGIIHTTLAYVNEGESVLVPNPGYPAYANAAKIAGAKIIYYNLNEKNNYFPVFEEIEKSDLKNVKIMWVNYPNMPTGTAGNMELFSKLVQFGLKHKILIVNDNAYSLILNQNPLSILSVPDSENIALELNSLSKSHNMAGWRIGVISGNKEFIKNILNIKSNIDSGMFLPLQLAAVKALNLDKSWNEKVNQIYKRRRIIAESIINQLKCTFKNEQTGLFIWARIPEKIENAEKFSDEIFSKTKVFITPGNIFGSNGDKYIRISLCANEVTLNEAFIRIKNNY